MRTKNRGDAAQVLEGKVFAILAYLPFLCIIPLLFRKDNDFVLSHGKQGLVIFVAEIGVFILSIVFAWLFRIGMFILLTLSFIGIIAVLKGRNIELPVISKIAEKITL
jgi:uncharacterized membrane protein